MVERYLDNSATTRVCDSAVATMLSVMSEGYGNPSSLHGMGFAAEQCMTAARSQVATVLGVDRDEIIWGSCGSALNNLAVLGAAHALRRSGNRIVTTAIEHSSLLGAVGALEQEDWEVIRVAPQPDGSISPAAIAEAVNDNTVLVSVMLVNSETGSINDLAAIAAAARMANPKVLVHSDCVQAFCRTAVTPRRWGVDMVTVSGHKIHAPKGVAALYRRRGVRLLPLYHGSAQEGGLIPGTENVPAIAAMGVAAHELWQQRTEYHAHLQQLHELLIKKITELPELCINSPPNGALHIVNVSAVGIRSEVMIHYLEQSGIYVSSGSACSKGKKSHVLTAMGLPAERIDSAIRISLGRYNTDEDIEVLVTTLREGCQRLARAGNKR